MTPKEARAKLYNHLMMSNEEFAVQVRAMAERWREDNGLPYSEITKLKWSHHVHTGILDKLIEKYI